MAIYTEIESTSEQFVLKVFLTLLIHAVVQLGFCTLQDAGSSLSIFTGEEEVFAFQRTVSRLTEMQTEEYWVEGDRSSS